MNEQDPSMAPSTPTCDPNFTPPGLVTLVLDAPQAAMTTPTLPKNFRSMQKVPNISGTAASGSAQYSQLQFKAMFDQKVVTTPLVVVDLRQESHGFLLLKQPLNGDQEIAVGWFVERDWLNVDKGLPSILADESSRLKNAAQINPLSVYEILTKSPAEDGICTVEPFTVNPTGNYYSEHDMVTSISGVTYLRLPSSDHCRPRDSEVDQFVAFEVALPSNTWLHFHCRAGDGRTTTFMAMHDIIHNAQTDSLQTILERQKNLGGIDLYTQPSINDQSTFKYPFSYDRWMFMQNFYTYVTQEKSGGFKVTWSDWVTQNLGVAQLAASA